MPRWLRSMFGSDYYDDRYRYRKRKITYKDRDYDDRYQRRRGSIHRDGAYYGSTAGRVATTTSQVCGACGKFRSPSWSSRHPLRYGEVPRSGLCRKCAAKSTSSERSTCSRRPRRLHRHPRTRPQYTDCTDDYYSSFESRDPCYLRRRYRSDSMGYVRPRSLVSIASTDDLVRVSRRVLVDRPVRRGILKPPSSCSVYSDEVVEKIIPPRRPLRRTRTRSGSSVRFVDELDRPYYQHRPRSLSRRSSREEIVVSRPRSYSRRRRPVYYDGPADVQNDGLTQKSIREEEKYDSLINSGAELESAGMSNVLPKPQTGQNACSESLQFNQQTKPKDRTYMSAAPVISPRSKFPQTVDGPSRRPNNPCDDARCPDLDNSARIAFEDYSYEVDSQFPSPPVHFTLPNHRRSRSFSPLQLPAKSLRKMLSPKDLNSHDTAAFRPGCIVDDTATAIPPERTSDHVLETSTSLDTRNSLWYPDTPPTSVTSSERNSGPPEAIIMTAISPKNADQVDYLADLLSTTKITPRFERKDSPGLSAPPSSNPSCESLPTIWRYDPSQGSSSDNNASLSIINQAGLIHDTGKSKVIELPHETTHEWLDSSDDDDDDRGQQSGSYHPRARAEAQATTLHPIFDKAKLEQKYYETAVDYEAEGRAYMDNVRRQRAMQEHRVVDAV